MDEDALNIRAESSGSSSSYASHDEVEAPSSATSPSSQRSMSTCENGRTEQLSRSKALEAFTSDLDNYLPLGCLCFEDLAESFEDHATGVWRDITHLPLAIAFEETLYSHLHKLAASGWIRIFSARSHTDSRYLIFRIYILPFDVGLRLIDRQSKRLYSALESLISEVDVSREAWQGRHAPETAIKFDKWATTDEGSLFWMFNKLPSPSPSSNKVKEKYAREALEDILDPVSLIPGLKTQLYPYQRRSTGLMLERESISTLELDPRLECRSAPDGTTFYYSARDLMFLKHPRYYENCKGGVLAETMGLVRHMMGERVT